MLHLFHKAYSPLRSEIDGGLYNISCRFADIDQYRRQHRPAGPHSGQSKAQSPKSKVS